MKLNKNQRRRRLQAFKAMNASGNKSKAKAPSPFRNAYPIAAPVPIIQHHVARGAHKQTLEQIAEQGFAGRLVAATTLVPAVAFDPVLGRYPTDESGRVPMRPASVCIHRCTHINTRHNAPVAK